MRSKIIVETREQMEQIVEQLHAEMHQEETSEYRRNRWRLSFATPGFIEDKPTTMSTENVIYITTRDISAEGLGFFSRHPINMGKKIFITLETDAGDVEIPGIVMHCTETVGMHEIGVKFDLIEPQNNY